MSDVAIKIAWRRNDAKLMVDAKDFWTRYDLLPTKRQEGRAKELVAVGYRDGIAVAVTTAKVQPLPPLRARFYLGRVAVAPDHRRSTLGARLGGHMRRTLEAWSLEHPEEDVKGFAGVITAEEFGAKQREPIWFDWGVDIMVVGYTDDGAQIRAGWFRHARL